MSQSSSVPEPSRWFRADINGLRALGILPVVIFHSGVTAIPGGFVGVDIFYVISGFLITTLLIAEFDSSGHVRFGRFWAKRLRRLVPGLALMVLATLVAASMVLPTWQWPAIAKQGGSALAYVSNFVFARQSTDYFGGGVDQSPFLHTWSLGVEEQFYLLWPLLVVVGGWIAHRLKARPRIVLGVVFGITLLLSFAASVVQTAIEPSWAFYMLHTRAWEFAAAGILALLPLELAIRSRAVSTIISLLGFVLIAYSLFTIKATDPFPGSVATIPVIGTLLVIAAGAAGVQNQGFPSRLLSTKPIQWIGTISYSWYLWHWPFIVLTAVAFNSDAIWLKLVAAAASLVAATASYYLVEKPIRFSPKLTSSLGRTFVVTGSVTALVGVLAAALFFAGRIHSQEIASLLAVRSALPTQECDSTGQSSSGTPICEFGDLTSDTTLMLVGDSHAGHWKVAMGEAASEAGVKLVVRWRPSCPATFAQVVNLANVRDDDCSTYQHQTIQLAEELKPDAIILSQAAAYGGRIISTAGDTLELDAQLKRWSEGYAEFLDVARKLTPTLAVVIDNPRLHSDPIDCLSKFGATAADCSVPREAALDQVRTLNKLNVGLLDERKIVDRFDITDTICGPERCNVVSNDVPVFLDFNHLSAVWTKTQVPALRTWIATLL